jgi:hypothetical protein
MATENAAGAAETTPTPASPVMDFNPLDEQVNEKSYSSPNINASGVNLNTPIGEPRFAPPPIESRKLQDEGKPPPREPINPEMKNLGKKDTEMAAQHMTKMIFQGYEWMHDLGNKWLMVSEKKLNKLQNDGEINLNAMIDYEYGKKIRAGDYFQEYNHQVSNVLTVSQEFKDEVTPVLERVLAKRGIGMTDEQLLIFLFGKDIAAKSIIIFQMKTQTNMMIASIKEATTSQYAQAAPAPAPQPASQPASTPPPSSPSAPQSQQTETIHYTEPEETKNNFPALRPRNPRGRPPANN